GVWPRPVRRRTAARTAPRFHPRNPGTFGTKRGEVGRSIRGMSTRCGRARRRALVLSAALGLAVASPLPASEASAAPTRAEKQDARAAWTKGRKEAARKRWSQAAELFREAVDLDPKAQYRLDLVRALIAERLPREASEVLDELDG